MWKFWRGETAKRLMAEANEKAMEATLIAVGEKSDSEVPHDTGALSRTRFIKVEDGSGLISYGGGHGTGFPKIPYAVRWHENSANFQKGRKKRYLADPFNKLAARKYKQALKKEGYSRLTSSSYRDLSGDLKKRIQS